METKTIDVVVVGAGNAGLVAALAASEKGAKVLVLEAAPIAERGGNSRFAGAIFRTVHEGFSSVQDVLTEESRAWSGRVDFGPYTRGAYISDWMSIGQDRPDNHLVDIVVDGSNDTLRWMHERGVEFELTVDKLFDPATFDSGQVYDMVPGGAIRAAGEGVGLVQRLFDAVEADENIEVWYDSPVSSLIVEGATVKGVQVRKPDQFIDVEGTVVLAAGGFEANPEMRLRYLGPGWDTVKVRGTRFNMGSVLQQALQVGAQPTGHWEGAHASPLDNGAPKVGDLRYTDKFSRYSYPYAVLVNRLGERFVDEGENQVWLTYAKTGSAIRIQPGGIAHQIFDQRTAHLLEPRYATTDPIIADTLEELADKLRLPRDEFLKTIRDFNDSVATDAATRFDRFHEDGVDARPAGQPRKSNWAQRIDRAPFIAYTVACGITFTYGGLKVDDQARVIDTVGQPMPGLFATGEIIGDFFYYNYAGGAGLMRGAVFGRLAGAGAARHAHVAVNA
ncbi:MAG: FAD-dependent oxidoreductase [Frondihabitans sp.]|nr:FAD-dependent oxidoreductase [Frondihabitans sp.]